ncbi:MAG: ComF family protein [Candidatus Marinimicrobia bacterium]|jgi:ComF family protein|nr:ComF family protein [Candidatus Neomarinimicrobiota bacterium]MDP7059366.1 ComF family protein [Candidatus Neomarinimicrobiota bacterium]|tara:strand:+ start:652 stop:1359 length:708 start_codon:yes stop_codon:yes gene_type:complete
MSTSFPNSLLKTGLFDLLYPPFCRLCDQKLTTDEIVFCGACLNGLEATYIRNWIEKITFHDWLDEVYSGWFFDEKMQIIIHALKYDEMVVVGDLLGTRLAEMFRDTLFSLQLNVLTAVPLHPVRLRERGYNQSNQLGEAVSKHLNLPFSADLLRRCKNTKSQTNLTANERMDNVTEAFKSIAEPPERVLIIDDVLTTGSTVSACAAALKRSGTKFVAVLTAGTPYFHGLDSQGKT